MKLVVVPHGSKLTGVANYQAELASDPPMTMEGKVKMLALVPALKALGPFDAVYCSLMDRACGSMCTIVKQLGVRRVTCIDELGQYGNLDSDGTVIMYPGHEGDNVQTWQRQGDDAVQSIWQDIVGGGPLRLGVGKKVLVFTHRPILAGLVASTSSISTTEGIQEILDGKGLTGQGFRIFECDGNGIIFGCNAINLRLEV